MENVNAEKATPETLKPTYVNFNARRESLTTREDVQHAHKTFSTDRKFKDAPVQMECTLTIMEFVKKLWFRRWPVMLATSLIRTTDAWSVKQAVRLVRVPILVRVVHKVDLGSQMASVRHTVEMVWSWVGRPVMMEICLEVTDVQLTVWLSPSGPARDSQVFANTMAHQFAETAEFRELKHVMMVTLSPVTVVQPFVRKRLQFRHKATLLW